MRPIPPQALAIVKEFEGLKLVGYLCPAGVPTAGWGHTGPDVRVGVRYTRDKAEAWLRADLQHAANRLAGVVKPDVLADLSDPQYAALLSFVFNLGAKSSWTIWKRVNARKFDLVPPELMRFVNAGGKRLPGLVRRRGAEAALWEQGEEDEPETPPSTTLRMIGMTPPTPATDKPLTVSKTMWTGAGVAASGVVAGAQQVQALVAPQAMYHEHLQTLGAIVAGLIVAGGIAVMVFKWLEQRGKQQ
jgi:lysozyme